VHITDCRRANEAEKQAEEKLSEISHSFKQVDDTPYKVE
jgi:hypothetical protein